VPVGKTKVCVVAFVAALFGPTIAGAEALNKEPADPISKFFRSLISPHPAKPATSRRRVTTHHKPRVHRPKYAAKAPVEPKTALPAEDQKIGLPGDDVTRVLTLRPKIAASPEATHSVLMLTRNSFGPDIAFGGHVKTVQQLRTGSRPNPWECAWIVWHYQDSEHFYYLAIKPNGWEIGKRDPAYPGGQRFLASGSRGFPIGLWHQFLVTQNAETITVQVNGVNIASHQDSERPYTSGALGFYAEDAEVQIDDIVAPFVEKFATYDRQVITKDGHTMQNWVLPFLGYGYASIDDRKK
jgi:hypothetical protein